jgi:hypothetical protein
MRNIGIIAGMILVVGALALGGQSFLSGSTSGASADAPSDALIPDEIVMTKVEYQSFVTTFAEYYQADSLAEKNEIITNLRENFYDLVPH